MLDRKSLVIGSIIGLGIAALLFAFRLDQLNRGRAIADLIANNSAAERHKQVLSAINKKVNGKAKSTKAAAVNA